MSECTKCIHKCVCKTAESCDGFVSGCKHFKEQKKGRWQPQFEYDFEQGMHRLSGYNCDQCGIWTLKKCNYCPNCGADMRGE
jgi:hypothetical protein